MHPNNEEFSREREKIQKTAYLSKKMLNLVSFSMKYNFRVSGGSGTSVWITAATWPCQWFNFSGFICNWIANWIKP